MLTFLLFSRAFSDPPESWLEQWNPWGVPIGQWGPVFASTGYVAHWCVIGHCVGIIATHGMSQEVVFATSHLPPTPPCPTPLSIPLTPSIINNDGGKGQQKYLEIQPSEIEKISYDENQLIIKCILLLYM